ncbi:BppU family phage baseplate upper protein [Clostridium felsineum]|uniref:BppU family phage baseplate upper protein n=1 Tax=Clostridium felsineum TaxID=36839 RepID=UPI00098C4805|nr:BppU family phage baseplate upper protein [Clostridium felsineum]URZ16851.1 hypothetical protein CLFE_028980 [Clostridium felsineum DSM 794]
MITREYTFMLNATTEFLQPPFLVKQSDSGSNIFNIQLIKDYSPVNLTGLILKFTVKKPDGNIIFQTPTVTDATTGQIKVVLTAQTLAVSGTANAEVSVYDNSGNRLTFFEFSFLIKANIDPTNAIESSGEFPAMTELVAHSHWHDNKPVLDDIPDNTAIGANNTLKTNADGSISWDGTLYTNTHTHTNKSTLDAIPDKATATTNQYLTKKADGSLAFARPNLVTHNLITNTTPNTATIASGITGYDSTLDLLVVSVNGVAFLLGTHYTVDASGNITFTGYTLQYNDEVLVRCYRNMK